MNILHKIYTACHKLCLTLRMKFLSAAVLLGIVAISQTSAGSLEFSEKPPTDLKEVIAKLKVFKNAYQHSVLAKTQLELWLMQLSVDELTQLKTSIPSMWSGTEISFEASSIQLEEMLNAVIEVHPEAIKKGYQARPKEFGRRAGIVDWKDALKTADQIEDDQMKHQYLIGVFESSSQMNSFAEAETLRLLIFSKFPNAQTPGDRSNNWTYLWPAESIADLAISYEEDKRFSLLRHVADNGNMFFSQMKEGEKYLQYFGRSAPGQAAIIGESMSGVFAARDPLGFIKWFQDQSENIQSFAIENAIEPLLRNDPMLIEKITPYFKDDKSYTALRIAQQWARYDRPKAVAWAKKLPASEVFDESFVFRDTRSTEKLTLKKLDVFFNSKQNESVSRIPFDRPKATTPIDKEYRTELCKLAHPGSSALVNASLYEQVFALQKNQVLSLLSEFETSPPQHAKDILVRRYLLESWVWYDPEAACDWILTYGDGRMRELIPLTFSLMKSNEAKETYRRLMAIPEEFIYMECLDLLGLK